MRIIEYLKENVRPLIKQRLLIPLAYLVIGFLHGNDLEECSFKILVANTVILSIILVKPRILFNFDSAILVLFFLWIAKGGDGDNSNQCEKSKRRTFLAINIWIFEFLINLFMFCILLLGIFVIIHILKGIFRQETADDVEIPLQGSDANILQEENGLSQEEIDNIKIELYAAQEHKPHHECNENKAEELCSICLCEFQNQQRILVIPRCKHVFHESCIKNWLKTLAICPNCRSNFRSQAETAESGFDNANQSTSIDYHPPQINGENAQAGSDLEVGQSSTTERILQLSENNAEEDVLSQKANIDGYASIDHVSINLPKRKDETNFKHIELVEQE